MRSSRLIAVLMALLFVLVAPAVATAQSSAPAKSPHTIKHLNAGEIGQTGKFFVKGQVTTFKGKFVKLQKAKCEKCAWKPFKQQKTSAKAGSFRMTFDGPRGSCYRLFVPGTGKNKPAYRKVGCIIAA